MKNLHLWPLALSLVLALALLATGCSKAGKLIPGHGEPLPPKTASQPILSPGDARRSAAAQVVPDADLAKSVVQILAVDGADSSKPTVVRNGSGVVVDMQRGLILTNYQIVNPYRADGTRAYSALQIASNRITGENPRPEYEAVLVAADKGTDIAVLKVTNAVGGGALATNDFNLPAVTIGDASALRRGEPLRLFGHPGYDAAAAPKALALLATGATLTGFRGSATLGGRGWIEVDARLRSGTSGGPAFDAAGRLIGVITQLAYDEQAPAGQVRPVDLALKLLEAARSRGTAEAVWPPEEHPGAVPGTSAAAIGDGILVDRPAFAANAVEGAGFRDLFDYTRTFATRPESIYYEFAVQGAPQRAQVQELWYLDGVLQDAVSSTYTWSGGPFAVIADRLVAPGTQGIPNGVWTLEVWINGKVRASNTVYVGSRPGTPRISTFRFAPAAGPDQAPTGFASAGTPQLLAFFDYRDAAGANQIRWVVFKDGKSVYQSPPLPWNGGKQGTWWVAIRDQAGLAAGKWEIEVYLDDVIAGSGGTTLP